MVRDYLLTAVELAEHAISLSCNLPSAHLIQLQVSLRLNQPLGCGLQNRPVPVQALPHPLRLVFGHELGFNIDVIFRNVLEKDIALANINASARDSLASQGVPRLRRHFQEVLFTEMVLILLLLFDLRCVDMLEGEAHLGER